MKETKIQNISIKKSIDVEPKLLKLQQSSDKLSITNHIKSKW